MAISKKLLVVIAGPTAVGKTEISIKLAKEFNAPIFSADARQFYRELEIGTAKPSHQQLASVQHFFINHKSIHDQYDVAQYEKDVVETLNDVFENNNIIILCGGSGLYIQAVLYGLNEMPGSDNHQRLLLEEAFRTKGIEHLQQMLQQLDPEYALAVDLKNPHRLIRALEVSILSGKPFSSFIGKKDIQRNFSTIAFNLNLSRIELYQKINNRVDKMIQEGLLFEANQLIPYKNLNALNTVGYAELFQFIEGKDSLEFAIEKIKQHTRNYAKRQITWFKKMHDFEIIDTDYNLIVERLYQRINALQEKER